jgi:hypothetical protein
MATSAPLPVVVQLGSGSALRPGCVCARPSSLCEHEAASNLCSPCLMRARLGFSWEEIEMLMGVPVPAPSSRAGREQRGQRAGTRITERKGEREREREREAAGGSDKSVVGGKGGTRTVCRKQARPQARDQAARHAAELGGTQAARQLPPL